MMTTPDERTRSLRWAHELLGALSSNGELAAELRERASAASSAFPSPQAIQSLIDSNAERLPIDMAMAIEAARAQKDAAEHRWLELAEQAEALG